MKLKIGSVEMEAEVYTPPKRPAPYPGRALDPDWWPRDHIERFSPQRSFDNITRHWIADYSCRDKQTTYSEVGKRGFISVEAHLVTYVSGVTLQPNDIDSTKSRALGMKLLTRAALASPKALNREIQRLMTSNKLTFDVESLLDTFRPNSACTVSAYIDWLHLSLRFPGEPRRGLILLSLPARLDFVGRETDNCEFPEDMPYGFGAKTPDEEVQGRINFPKGSSLRSLVEAQDKERKARDKRKKIEHLERLKEFYESRLKAWNDALAALERLLAKRMQEDLAREDLSESEREARAKQMQKAFEDRQKQIEKKRALDRAEVDRYEAEIKKAKAGG